MRKDILDSSAASLFAFEDGSIFFPRTTMAQITADQNSYTLPHGTFFRLDTDAARSINGIFADSSYSGRLLILVQTAAFNLTLVHQSGSAGNASYRMIAVTGANIVLAQNEMAVLIWDLTTNRWRAAKL
jgi:hypothetical protein